MLELDSHVSELLEVMLQGEKRPGKNYAKEKDRGVLSENEFIKPLSERFM